MAEKSGFFNALLVDEVYDRKYNANDYSDNLAVVIGNGVLRSTNDDLKVTASGMVVSVGVGRAWINGHWYNNDATYTFSATSAPVSGARWDRVMLRFDNQLLSRKVSLVYVQGTAASSPTKPSPTRTSDVYDLVLADIYVQTNSSTLTVTDTRSDTSLCGWVYSTSGDNSFFTSLDASFETWFREKRNTLSSVTLFKRYAWATTLTAASSTVSFSIPQYDSNTCFLEVYVNGILDREWTISGSVITFDGSLVAGTKIVVYCFKSIDGTGIQSVSDEITQLQNQMAEVQGTNKYVYTCTGSNDNIALSQIAQAFQDESYTVGSLNAAAEAFLTALGGNTYLSNLSDEAQITISVVGKLGATTPFYGTGTSSNRYRWFSLGFQGDNTHKLTFDFEKCESISISCAASTSNIIFYGKDLNIKNANVNVNGTSGTGCSVQVIGSSYETGNINVFDSKFFVQASGKVIIAENGNFTNCYCYGVSSADHALLFVPTSDALIRLIGGTYYAYIGTSGKASAVTYVYATETNAVLMAYNINCPEVTKTGYSQQYFGVGYGGKIYVNGVVSTLRSIGNYIEVVGLVSKSKR